MKAKMRKKEKRGQVKKKGTGYFFKKDKVKKKGTGYFFKKDKAGKSSLSPFLIEKVACPLFLCLLLALSQPCQADPDKAAFISRLVYRADGEGDYTFEEAPGSGAGTITPAAPYATEGTIYSITANWTFTGIVTMEVSATGSESDYVSVVNGVPLEYGEFTSGKKLIWRANLTAGSTLEEVSISYNDLSGVIGSFGNPELSGFMFRKPVYVTGGGGQVSVRSGDRFSFGARTVPDFSDLYHYQVAIKVGESSRAGGCDFYLKGVIQSDFADVRFTNADQETLLPYWLEGIYGTSPNRTATYWVKIPQLPPEGLTIYLYYGSLDAEDLSDGEAVFDFFDDFDGYELDSEKWEAALNTDSSRIEAADSLLRVQDAKIISAAYEFGYGILEYKAKSTGGAIAGIIRGSAAEGEDMVIYSSAADNAQHCIAVGDYVKANSEEPIGIETFYVYSAAADGTGLAFIRYGESGFEPEAEAEYEDTGAPDMGFIGVYSGGEGTGAYYDWIRVRQLASPAPGVDKAKTAKAQEEVPDLPEFNDVALAANGDLVLGGHASSGEYISRLIHAPFQARIIVPSWDGSVSAGNSIAMDISAKEYGIFKEDCVKDAYYYSSKKDFTKGDALRSRIRLSRKNVLTESPSLRAVYMDFMPGAINIISPNGGESLAIGAQAAITWDAAGYEESYPMNIYYSADGGRNFERIASSVKNSGRYVWEISGFRVQGTGDSEITDKCVVKITDSLDEDVYDVSNDYFSIGPEASAEDAALFIEDLAEEIEAAPEEEPAEAAEEEPAEEEEEPEDAVEKRPGTSLYELLVKKGTNPNEGGYKDGDIVMIKPAGFRWGGMTRQKFNIIQAYLTPEEVEELTKPKKSEDGIVVRRRKHGVDLSRQDITDAVVSAFKRLTVSKPLVDITAIEEK